MSIKKIAGPFLALLLFLSGNVLFAQTATTGLISGVVSDPTGAVIPGATVVLQQQSTNLRQQTTTDSVGHYVFPTVDPADYAVTFSATGFQNTVVRQMHVEVQKGYALNISLKVGTNAQTVEVADVPTAELQTTTSTVGAVLGGIALESLPVFTRSASALMLYQPGISPSGQISGARLEQVTFSLDGGDVTSDLEGSNTYAAPPGEPQPSPVVPVPIESTQEFQVATSNPNATFARSSGGQVSLLTKRGTNSYHGSVYEYHNDDGLNANGWTNNFSHLHKPHAVDNRFGVAVGGPIFKDRLWFFANYEGRRLYSPNIFNAVVPTPSFQSGIIKLGTSSYSLQPGNISTACGPAGGLPCDPRGIGMSPVIKAQLALYPAGNNPQLGDGLNTTGLTFNAPTPIVQDLGVLRLDYKFSDKWSAFATDHMSNTSRVSTTQFSLLGTPGPVSQDPIKPQYYTLEVTGHLTPNFTAVTRTSWMRDWWGWNRVSPAPLVPGTQTALVLSGEGSGTSNSTSKLFADPVNLATQAARPRFFNGKKFTIAEDLNWIRGKHLLQFGGSWYTNHDVFEKTDNFAGGLSTGPLLYVESTGNGSGVYLGVGNQYQPPGLSSSNALRWNELYSSLLGLVDRSSQVVTRDGNFQPYPVGTPSITHTRIGTYSAYFQDIWRASSSLTMTLGLNWQTQPTPHEDSGRYDVLVYADSGKPVDYWNYFAQRAASLNAGVAPGAGFNPLFGVVPVNKLSGSLHGSVRITDWKQFAPRLAAAWQPQFNNFLFGDKKTVIRGGYALVWDRISDINQVSLVTTTGGLLDANACGGPTFAGGLKCTNAATTPATAFRIGVDGSNVPVPAPLALPIPYVPTGSAAAPFGLFMMSGLDPYGVPAHSHTFDLTVQRELPGRMIFEAGYIGRVSRNLPQDIAYNATDYLMKDQASGQTFAQAFDAVAVALRGGTTAAAVPVQAFFENQMGGSARCAGIATTRKLSGITTCSALLAAVDKTDLVNGSINNLALNALNQLAPSPIDNIQTFQSFGITDRGFSNYQAGFLSLNKSLAKGLQFQANWTWSHSIGNQGVDQQNGSSANSPYNINLDKASESFDRRHVVNLWWYYQLPFGHGSATWIDRVIGGWNSSGIYTFSTGVPLHINANGDYGAYESNGTAAICGAPMGGLESEHSGIVGSGGIATGGNTATGGSGRNIFADPVSVYNSCSRPLLSVNDRIPFDELHALPRWNVDLAVGKVVPVTERVGLSFSAELLNAFNVVVFNNPSLNLNSASNFGVLSSQANTPRKVLLGLKVQF